MLDVGESGKQIGEKLASLLSIQQQEELIQYFLAKRESAESVIPLNKKSSLNPLLISSGILTEIQAENIYFCLENRLVLICDTEIELTEKEFDVFALLILNHTRIITYDMIMDRVWHEKLDFYSRRAINNHISNLRKKLMITPQIPDYIKSVRNVGYRFNPDVEIF